MFVVSLLVMISLMFLESMLMHYLQNYTTSCGNEYQCGDKVIYGLITAFISSIAVVPLALRRKLLYVLLIFLLIPPAYNVYLVVTSISIR